MTIIRKTRIKRSLISAVRWRLSRVSRKRTNHERVISRIPSHYFATDRRSAFLRSSDRIFSSLEGIACISLGKFVNNHVNADCVRLQTLFTIRDTVLAWSRIQFGWKARITDSRDHFLTRRISLWFITKLSFSLIPLLWQCQWRSQCTSARINLIGDIYAFAFKLCSKSENIGSSANTWLEVNIIRSIKMQRDDIFDAIHMKLRRAQKKKKLFLSVISLSKSNESIYRITKLMLGLHLASISWCTFVSDCNG